MKRINIVTEGLTEERFVSFVLCPYLAEKNIFVTPRNINCGNNFDRLKFNVVQWLKEDRTSWVTTMVDLYGLNDDFPGYKSYKGKQPIEKVRGIENEFKVVIDSLKLINKKFVPYFQLHEFEAYLFSDTAIMEKLLKLEHSFKPGIFQAIRKKFETPEHINDSVFASPSKRILKVLPMYIKSADGILIAKNIGVNKIRKECSHFNEWITKLENL